MSGKSYPPINGGLRNRVSFSKACETKERGTRHETRDFLIHHCLEFLSNSLYSRDSFIRTIPNRMGLVYRDAVGAPT